MMNSQQTQQQLSNLPDLPERLKNKWWRLTHLYKVKNKEGELVTFFPNIVQLKHIRDRGSHRYCRICKARQHGFTTFYCIDYLDESLWIPGTASAIIAHRQDALQKIFEIVKRAFDNLPEQLKPKTDADNSNELKFETRFDGVKLDSGIYVAMKVRSGTVHNLHITEKAYIKDLQELKAGSKQAVPKTGRITEETTANGMDEFFDDFTESMNNPNPGEMDYKAFFYAWFENPDYTLDGSLDEADLSEVEKQLKVDFGLTDGQLIWRRWKIKELASKQEGVGLTGEQLFKQEYPSTWIEAFQSGSGNVFDQERLEKRKPEIPMSLAQIKRECEEKRRSEVYLAKAIELLGMGVRFYRLPEYGKEYVSGCDPSDGDGSDNGCIDVWMRPDEGGVVEQVAQWYGKARPDDLALINKELAEFYFSAYAGVENNMLTTILELSKIYDNYYFTVKIDEKKQKKTKKLGWNTNIQTREKMIDDFIKHEEEDLLIIRSAITLSEMRTFVKKRMPSGSIRREHASNKWDDALFAAFIAVQMTLYRPAVARVFARGSVSL